MNKKLCAITCVMLVVVCLCVFCGCIFGGNLFDRINLPTGKIVYDNSNRNVPDYSTVTDANVAEVVAQIALPAVYEISCEIVFSYQVTDFWGRGYYTQTGSVSSQGTGFVVSQDGYMVTNAHVINVEDSSSYRSFQIVSRKVYASHADRNESLVCDVIAYNEKLDLALLRIEPTTDSYTLVNADGSEYKFDYVSFFNHVNPVNATETDLTLHYGETAVAVGNANGYGIAVTQGLVSAPLRNFKNSDGSYTLAVQTDAAINPGNSGGPLFNAYGAVIGIISFKIVTSSTENLGYAIPSYVVTDFLDSLHNGNYSNLTVGSDGQKYNSTVNVNYSLTLTREYKNDGSNVVSKFSTAE